MIAPAVAHVRQTLRELDRALGNAILYTLAFLFRL